MMMKTIIIIIIHQYSDRSHKPPLELHREIDNPPPPSPPPPHTTPTPQKKNLPHNVPVLVEKLALVRSTLPTMERC